MCLTGVCYSHWIVYGLYPNRACALVEKTEYKHTYVSIIKSQDLKKNDLYPNRTCISMKEAKYKHTYIFIMKNQVKNSVTLFYER